jgi:hypothetical protein
MLFYSQEQYDEYMDELAYSPAQAYRDEMARLAWKEIEHEGEYDPMTEEQGPQERTATWVQEGSIIWVRYPNGCCIDLPRYQPVRPFPKLGDFEIDDEIPF